jgi:pyrimidine deaminase RibD-like protein
LYSHFLLSGFSGGERGPLSAFPNPTVAALLVSKSGHIIGKGRSDFRTEAVREAIIDAGLQVTPLRNWCVSWPSDPQLREALSQSTLYVTLEPSAERKGTALPPITQLIHQAGITNVVIGCLDPVPELASKGAAALHTAGIQVILYRDDSNKCQHLITQYSQTANSKLAKMARKHFQYVGRPLGFLHCSVVDSLDMQSFARNGNAFGKDFGSAQRLGFREFGSYEIAPPPEVIWADPKDDEDDDSMSVVDFEDEYFDDLAGQPMMPWYEQVDAVVATFPGPGNGPKDDDSIAARLSGLKWLATHGEKLPAGVERILVMDATDLETLPMTNNDPNLPPLVDVERFWKGEGRKPTRVLLRRGINARARAAAAAAAVAAEAAAKSAKAAAEAIESGDAARAAQVAIEYKKSAQASAEFIQQELQAAQSLKSELESKGVLVEMIEGGDPIDVMKHLGERNGLHTVVWRAGCWGTRGADAVLAGAFQWVSAHLAVDASGGKFWQLMLAENAVQASLGPERKVKIFSEQQDLSLEYCDEPGADMDCTLQVNGRPVRHIRLDCRVALFDEQRARVFEPPKTARATKKMIEEQAPWFL